MAAGRRLWTAGARGAGTSGMVITAVRAAMCSFSWLGLVKKRGCPSSRLAQMACVAHHNPVRKCSHPCRSAGSARSLPLWPDSEVEHDDGCGRVAGDLALLPA